MARIKVTPTNEEKLKSLLDEGIVQFSSGRRDDGYPIIHLTPDDDEYGEVMKKILKRKLEEEEPDATGTDVPPTTLQLWIDRVEKDFPGQTSNQEEEEEEEEEEPREARQSAVTNFREGSDSERQRLLLMGAERRLMFLTKKYFLKKERYIMRRIRNMAQHLDGNLRLFKKRLLDSERFARERGFNLTANLYKDFHAEYHRIGAVKIKMLNYVKKVTMKYDTATDEKFKALQNIVNDFSEDGEISV